MYIYRWLHPIHFTFVFLILSFSGKVFSDGSKIEKLLSPPTFEIGMGIANLYYPNYPGAEQYTNLIFPFPYAYYRGEWIEASRDKGIRSRIFETAKVELSLSFSGSLPVDSKNNDARTGMDDLDWIYEFGPSLVYSFSMPQKQRLHFQLPLRLVSSTNFAHTQEHGVLFNPTLAYRYYNVCKHTCFFEAQINAEYATKKLHQYFYDVVPKFVTAERPQYNSDAGNLSYGALLKYRIQNDTWLWGVNLGYNTYMGNANTDSPLLKLKHSFNFSFFYANKLWESDY